ncbi:hypothetical protein GALL_297480 [mine drainage metagenome]|uniref:Uncharacterized protein n=1 Tax=mine drainage metagenome TaxID=410659 RepID=A0A1J5RFI9_9ZZZZ
MRSDRGRPRHRSDKRERGDRLEVRASGARSGNRDAIGRLGRLPEVLGHGSTARVLLAVLGAHPGDDGLRSDERRRLLRERSHREVRALPGPVTVQWARPADCLPQCRRYRGDRTAADERLLDRRMARLRGDRDGREDPDRAIAPLPASRIDPRPDILSDRGHRAPGCRT